MYHAALAACALAGVLTIAAAVLRWRLLLIGDVRARTWQICLWSGFALLSLGLVLGLHQTGHRDFTYALLAVWAAAAAALFVGGQLAAPSRGLLLLPVGGMALLVAMGGAFRLGAGLDPTPLVKVGGMPWIVLVHAAFTALAQAALLLAGAGGGLYLLAERQLKRSAGPGLRLPALPTLERLTERSLIIGAALLTGGLATGGGAMQVAKDFDLGHPTAVLGLTNLGLLVLVFALRAGHRLVRRRLAAAALVSMIISAATVFSLLVSRHG